MNQKQKNKELNEITAKINKIKQNKEKIEKKLSSETDKQNGIRAGTEFILSILVGGLIGHGIDSFFDTKPIATLIFIFLGIGTGFMAIYKISNNLGDSVGFSSLQNSKKQVKETQEKNSNNK